MSRKRLREGAMSLSCHDYWEWEKHTPEKWRQWVDELPPAGHWAFSREKWREWTHLMMAIKKDIDAAAPRKRAAQKAAPPSPSPEEEEEESYWAEKERPLLLSAPQCSPRDAIASTLAQGPPAQGQLGPPAQGPPAQGHAIYLPGKSANERQENRKAIRCPKCDGCLVLTLRN